MKRFVSYLYSIYNNQKIHNSGFARVELRTGRNRVDIHLRENGYTGKTGMVYLFIRKQENIQGIPIGNITFRNNQADFRYEQPEENIGQTPWQIQQMSGIIVLIDNRPAFLSQWDEQPVNTNRFEVWSIEKVDAGAKPSNEVPEKEDEKPGDRLPAKEDEKPGDGLPGKEDKKPGDGTSGIVDGDTGKQHPEKERPNMGNAQQKERPNMSHAQQKERPNMGHAQQNDNTQNNVKQANEGIRDNRQAEEKNEAIKDSRQAKEKTQDKGNAERHMMGYPGMANSRRTNAGRANMHLPMPGAHPIGNNMKQPYPNAQAQADCGKTVEEQASGIQTAELQPQPRSQWEQNWRYMLRMYPVLNQFEDNYHVLCVRIEIKDVRLLPDKFWSMVNNSFLLHGFFNYRYLIFGRIGQKWFIGIPGIYQKQEHVMASIFGFPDFLPQDKKNEKGEQPGYWYRILDINI